MFFQNKKRVGEVPGEVRGKALMPQRLMGRDRRVVMFGEMVEHWVA